MLSCVIHKKALQKQGLVINGYSNLLTILATTFFYLLHGCWFQAGKNIFRWKDLQH